METKTPKPRLVEVALYLGDNGRCFCGKPQCAGATAYFTARDLSGQKVVRVPEALALEVGLRCETCNKGAKS